MVNYREIIRLKTLDYSNARVASSCGSSRNTVAEVWNLAKEKNLIWPLDETMTNLDLHKVFYPYQGGEKGKKLPDFEYIHKELARPGVTLSLLWAEYCAQCGEVLFAKLFDGSFFNLIDAEYLILHGCRQIS